MYKYLPILCTLLLVLSGPVFSHCGSCPGDNPDGQKGCEQKAQNGDGGEKACPSQSENGNGEKTCSAACDKSNGEKPCCAKEEKNGDSDHQCTLEKCPGAAPDFTLKDLKGKDVKLSDFLGKKFVVLEWTNWDCPFVKPHYEAGTFAKLIKTYTGKDKASGEEKEAVWLTINSTHYATPEANADWSKQHKLNHAVLTDADGKVGRLYKATNTPQIFVIDKAGHIAYQGAIDNAPRGAVPEGRKYTNYVDEALKELIAGKEVTTPKTKPYGCTVKYPPGETKS
jgi:peroxiredoxin